MYKTHRMIPLQAVSEEWLEIPLVMLLSWLLLSVMLPEHVHCTVIETLLAHRVTVNVFV